MTDWERDFIVAHRVARLATVDAAGQPHVLPIVYAFDGQMLVTPLDHKRKRVPAEQLQRVHNIRAQPLVAVVIDDYADDWQQLAWVQLRGSAAVVTAGAMYQDGIALLTAKYPQYRAHPLGDQPLIAIRPTAVRSWRAI